MFVGDSLTTAFSYVRSMLGFRGGSAPVDLAFSNEAGLQAYLSSGLLRKVIRIPAADRTSKWRDWQAEGDDIGKIEAEERRLGLRAKIKQAEILRGLGGGALILVTAGSHADELTPTTLGERGLIAVNVVSRWQLTCKDWDEDLASLTYGQPRMFEVRSNGGNNTQIHPSRVITFRGDPLPASGCVSMEQAFWGDSRLSAVLREVCRSDEVNGWFAALVRKAKITRYGIPNLSEMLAAPGGQERLSKRVATIAEGENLLNAAVYQSASGTDQPGETITDYQVTWAGIPAVMDAFDQRVAAVADIPFTRLMGRSPAGMNATGQHDMDNWWSAVSDGQENELRPCLEALDPLLLASAGVPADGVTWTFAPLSTPSEKERADTFKTTMDALTALKTMAVMPEEAFNEAAQNLLLENETLPGLQQILDDIAEDERFGVDPEADSTDPSALTQSGNGVEGGDPDLEGGAGGGGSAPARRAANDKATEE
ncbi:phage portal protein [Sphingomonas sp.]|uniref:phage portal protein n=1 Tax=Sphingomonas sp. TaxID=28214 RepID=UPI002FD8E76E